MTRLRDYPLGEVIAERQLEWHMGDGQIVDVAVRFGKPVEDDGSWKCPYRITSPSWSRGLCGVGVDAVQAVLMALQLMQSEFIALARKHGGTFSWLEMVELGFPPMPHHAMRRVLDAPIVPPPTPWSGPVRVAVGGLLCVGFGPGSDLLLVASHDGLAVVDAKTGERAARDRDVQIDHADLVGLSLPGIGPLEGMRVTLAGLFGGGLAKTTHDGWSVELVPTNWPDAALVLLPPGSDVFSQPPPPQHKLGAYEAPRVAGFSPTGESLVVAEGHSLVFFSRTLEST